MENKSVEKKKTAVTMSEIGNSRPRSQSQVLQQKLVKLQNKSSMKVAPKSGWRAVFKGYWKFMFVFIVPLVLLPLPLWGFHKTAKGIEREDKKLMKYGSMTAAGYTLLVMVIFWITEALPLPVTSLLPVVLYPLFGILDSEEVSRKYFGDSILIFLGGINMALAFECSNLHKRIALRVILCFGTSVRKLLLGILSTTSFLSMWMSNTAVAALMVPIILAVTDELERCMQDSLNREFDESSIVKEPSLSLDILANLTVNKDLSTSASAPALKTDVFSNLESSTAEKNNPTGLVENIIAENSVEPGQTVSKFESITSILSEGDAEKLQKQLSMNKYLANMKTMFLLSIAYGSNIGGTGVITGSGTNIVALGHLSEEQIPTDKYGKYAQVTFLSWLEFNLPITVVNIFITYWFLLFWFMWYQQRKSNQSNHGIPELENKNGTKKNKPFVLTKKVMMDTKKSLEITYKKMGRTSCHETAVLIVFALAIVLWIFHDPKVFPGWANYFQKEFRGKDIEYVSLTTPAIIINMLLFTIPKNKDFYMAFVKCKFHETKYEALLNWSYVHNKFPWGVVLLLGGGFAMSQGVTVSGLGAQIGCWLQGLATLPIQVFLLIVCLFITFFTEVASNTAVAQIFIPILRDLCFDHCWHPLILGLPAAVACSFAFMLPVGTPPNAIVFQAGKMKISQMVRPGVVMNIITTLVLFVFTISWGEVVFGFEFNHYCNDERYNASLKRKKNTC